VTTGASNSFHTEIKSGLKAGEKVVLPDPVLPSAQVAPTVASAKKAG
jgi:hypothetical protein